MLPTIDGAVSGAAAAAGLSNVKTMELGSAFNARRLCEKGVGLLEEEGLSNLESVRRGRQNRVVQPDPHGLEAIFGPYELQEDIHPNYWAQLALRNCLTQAYNAGTPKGGTCTISAHRPERGGRAEHVAALDRATGRSAAAAARRGGRREVRSAGCGAARRRL